MVSFMEASEGQQTVRAILPQGVVQRFPNGLHLDEETGRIVGFVNSSSVGSYPITVRATNTTDHIEINVSEKPIILFAITWI